jgi:hypothetical protein
MMGHIAVQAVRVAAVLFSPARRRVDVEVRRP